ncbi:carboxypeptidase regulatory-like domain-containing protein [Halopiger thermotolerans]
MQVERSLTLALERGEVSVGERLAVRVRDGLGRPIDGAIVEAGSGSKRRRTDEAGYCEFTFHAPGFWKLTARKPSTDRVAYEPTTALVRAVPGASLDWRPRTAQR